MTRREKKLLAVTGSVVALLAVYGVAHRLVIVPARTYKNQARALRDDLLEHGRTIRQAREDREQLQPLVEHTFRGDAATVREKLDQRLTSLLERAGFGFQDFVRQPLPVKTIRDRDRAHDDRVIGRSISIRGRPSEVVNFLWLLKNDPYVHRVEDLALSPDPASGRMDMSLKYYTLLLDVPTPATVASQPVRQIARLSDPNRDGYDAILRRDVFRPYVPRPTRVVRRPAAPADLDPQPPTPAPTPSAAVDPASGVRVVGLPTWAGEPEVQVVDSRSSPAEVRKCTIGDRLGTGTVVKVDYRPMPLPTDPKQSSPSRVILKIGSDYWAVELGQTLAEKHRLSTEDLPEDLKPAETSNAESGPTRPSAG